MKSTAKRSGKVCQLFLVMGIFLGFPGCKSETQHESNAHHETAWTSLDLLSNIRAVVILGDGPAGLTAGGYAARAGWDPVIFQGPKPGGLLTETTWVENWPGVEKILGLDIIKNLRGWAQGLGAIIVEDAVTNIDLSSRPFKITTERGDTVYALSLILATGSRPAKLNVPGEDEYWAFGVTTCATCDAPFFKGKDVVVVGGGDSAAEEAMQLARYARQVTILVRKESMRAAKRMQDLLKGFSNIRIWYSKEVKEVVGNDKGVTGIMLFDAISNTTTLMPIDGVFLAIGHYPNSELVASQVACDSHGYIIPQGRSQRTSVPGLFVAGDVADPVYRQVTTAQGMGCMAALDADKYLNAQGFNVNKMHALSGQLYIPNKSNVSVVHQVSSLKELQAIIKSHSNVFVDFYADHCPSCMQMLPAIEQVAREFDGEVYVVKVDTDEALDIVTEYQVSRIPHLLAFKNQEIVGTYRSVLTLPQLREVFALFR